MAADGSVIIDTRMDTSGVQNGVSAIRQSFNGLGSVVKKNRHTDWRSIRSWQVSTVRKRVCGVWFRPRRSTERG